MKTDIHRILELGYAYRLVWQCGRWLCMASIAVTALRGILPLVSLFLLKRIVDAVVLALGEGGTPETFRRVFWYMGWAAGVALLEAAGRGLGTLIAEDQSQTVADRMQERIQAKSAAMDLAFYETPSHQDTLHRAQVEARYRPLRIVNEISKLSVNLLSLGGVGVVLMAFHWLFGLILLICMVPDIWYALRVSRQLFEWRKATTEKERKALYLHSILTSVENAMECKAYGFAKVLIARFKALRLNIRSERLQLLKRQVGGEFLAQSVSILVFFGGLGYLILQTKTGGMTVGSLVMFAQALRRAEGFIREGLLSFAHLYEDSLFLGHIREFMELEPTIRAPENPTNLPINGTSGFALKHVSFQYPDTDKWVLRDVSMELKPGRHVALVGQNGSGKSTLIKLLCRFYDPTEGVLECGGIDIRQFDPVAYRKLISIMFQNFNHYCMSARENIWLGNVALDPRDARLEQAARQADAYDMICRLPEGYETQLGRRFRKGLDLSYGEWQKIALSRTFLSDAPLLVLDEPGSFLDPNAEARVFENLKALTKDRTMIFVSHRFSTVRHADYIYVMDQGRIAEQGSHDDLLRLDGRYAEMFYRQATGYSHE
ncbi:MAG TPA: ABC transporter ATP-binding protein [Verrucomicrobia bacterium]|nr:ABC transporter ATP-binding protein [Verrucomicrobiota bacterium]